MKGSLWSWVAEGVIRLKTLKRARSARLGALSIGSARPSTMLPSFHYSTPASPGPWACRSGWLRPISWSCASRSGSTVSSLSFSSTELHRRSPPLCEGPRGPMVSYFGTLTGFYSAPSQHIVSGHHERAVDVLEREHGVRNVSHQVLRSGLTSNALPSPPTVFSTLRAREASGS